MTQVRDDLVQIGDDTGGSAVVDLGAPNAGHRWDLRRISVFCPSKGQVPTAEVFVMFGRPPTVGQLPPFSEVVDVATFGIPYSPRYTSEAMIVEPEDHVLVVVQGVNADDIYVTGMALDREEGVYPR